MTWDLLVRDGVIIDGTGAERRRGDLAVKDGRIVAMGDITGEADRIIDAAGLIVAPGFFDPHTHYDAQICWDPLSTPSSSHGVTTVVMGLCGVGIAPCKPEAREIATWDLVNVEGIPFDVLDKGITWEWETFPEYMDAAARRGSAINLGFLAPLTPFRHFVMGEDSIERAATTAETAEIKALLKQAVEAGALGFSTSMAPSHVGYKGRPLASRQASLEEMTAYANALKELGRGAIEIQLTKALGLLDDEEFALLDLLLTESGRPVLWGGVLKRFDRPDAYLDTMRKADPLIRRGAIPQILNFRVEGELNLHSPFNLGPLPSWAPAFNQSVDAQMALYLDPGFRQAFRREFESPLGREFLNDWEQIWVKRAGSAALKGLEGKTVAEIAHDRSADPLDTFLDVSVEDGLDLTFGLYVADVAKDLISDPRTMISLGDGGAHVTMICDAGYCTQLLGSSVREEQLLTLELAVKRLTSEPAAFYGVTDRGRLEVGQAADIVIFDADTVGSSTMNCVTRHDLPGGAARLITEAEGIRFTVVNGQVVYEDGVPNNVLPGKILRSGEY